MTVSVNSDDVDINAQSKNEKEKVLYLKSMDSLMEELSKKYTDLSKNKGLSDEQIISMRIYPKNVVMVYGLAADVSIKHLDLQMNPDIKG
ncbi:MAG TPA: hypothetical protein VE619_10705 [Nitrososphaeraceae archaeon]|nr:hypothetical protein [Nitrososphaeraceae archaeon]